MTRRAAIVALGAVSAAVIGAVVAIVLSAFLSGGVTGILSTSGCGPTRLLQEAGFDPWTGLPRGRIVEVQCLFGPIIENQDVPADLAGRRGIPWATVLTIGSGLLGAGLALSWTRSDEQLRGDMVE
jgi:hypothetical protein